MRFIKKSCSIIVLLVFTMQLFFPLDSYASSQVDKPSRIDVAQDENGSYKIYDKIASTQKHHVELTWPDISFSNVSGAQEPGFRIYTAQDGQTTFKPYPRTVSSNYQGTSSTCSLDVDANGEEDLKSGTVYHARVTAFHKHINGTVVTEDESPASTASTVSFLTNIKLEVETAGTDAIEIKWDDVKVGNSRIGYEIYYKESKDFGQYPDLTVKATDISATGPVKPVLAEKKLSYTVRGLIPGTIYYVKIKPIISDTIRHNPETEPVAGFTNIIASATRLSDNWWRIDWNRITNANLAQGEQIVYQIKKGDSSAGNDQLPTTIGSTTDNKYYVEISSPNDYFFVSASVKNQSGEVMILESDHLQGVEADVPANPPMPELQTEILEVSGDANSSVYDYDDELKSTQAKLAWTPPKLANGSIDPDIVYDMWLLTNPADINNPNAQKLRSDYSIPTSNYIYGIIDKTSVMGYSYTLADLTPNSVYYFKIVAKKKYTVNIDGQLTQKYYESESAIKAVITPTGGPIDQPTAPSKPPLKVKLTTGGKQDVGTAFINVQWKNLWWEIYKDGVWKEPYDGFFPGDTGNSSYADVAGDVYRQVVYDSDVKFDIGYVEYPTETEDINFDQIVRSNPSKVVGITNELSTVIQTYKIEGLNPNTKYIVWLKAHRQTGDLISEPSDPLVVVTEPEVPDHTEKPVVPTFTYTKGGDTYVDLQWTTKTGYYYNIKYNTSDVMASAQDVPRLTPADLESSTLYRVTGLDPNTSYYFWIQADSTESISDQEESTSLWSDSISQKTTPYIAPDIPKGFGIKDGEDSIGKNSVTLEWVKEQGLTYILQISTDIDYQNATEYKDIDAAEYIATGLRSNLRYWARLYAYDPQKELRSDPTQSITFKTARSNDDYDSDVDTEDVITGPFIEDDYSGGVWTVKIIGINADRFIEKVKTDNILDYKIDMASEHSGAKKRVILIANRVFTALSELRENISIDSGFSVYTIRPNVMNSDQVNQIAAKSPNVNIGLTIIQTGTSYGTGDRSLIYESPASDISVNIVNGTQSIPLNSFNNPLKAAFPYANENLFADGKVNGYIYDDANMKWNKQAASAKFDKLLDNGYAVLEMKAPGKAALLKQVWAASAFYDISGHPAENSIRAISAKFELPSVGTGYFRPYEAITLGDAAKLIMDLLGYKYNQSFSEAAAKAGLINARDIANTGNACTGRQFMRMLDRMYEIRTGESGDGRYGSSSDNKPISRGDAIQELYYTLSDMGEL